MTKVIEMIGFKFSVGHWMFGALLAIVFLFFNYAWVGFSLAVPVLPQSSTIGEYFVSGFVMPIIEEVVFRMVLFWIFLKLAEKLTKNKTVQFIISLVGQATAFAMFHWFVYSVGGYVAKTSPLTAAFFFALSTGFASQYLTKDVSTAIVAHIIVNIILLTTFSIV